MARRSGAAAVRRRAGRRADTSGDGADAPSLERTEVGSEFRVPVISRDPLVDEQHGLDPVQVQFLPRRHRTQDDDVTARPDEEFVAPGPTSSRVAVVDYDSSQDTVYAPVEPLKDGTGFKLRKKVDLADFHFHQVNVWAIVNRTLAQLEHPRLLGRPIPWASGQGRLLILPHAGYGENAFYSRTTGGLHFLYFQGRERKVFTCLSHDIVTHELGHAVLDGLKPYYNDVSTVEAAGFHEYFGDALAITSSLTFRDFLARAVGDAPARLDDALVGRIGVEFGVAQGRGPLRVASERTTMSELEGTFEEHHYSKLLSNVFFELLRWLYVRKLGEARGRNRTGGQAAVTALVNAAAQTSRMMFRAIDYCPPVDVTYVDYARAVLHADRVAYPGREEAEVQAKVEELFVERGVTPSRAGETVLRNRDIAPYDVERLSASPEAAYRFLDSKREALGIPADVNLQVHRVYRTRKATASGFYPPREVVIEFVWTDEVALMGEGFGALAGKHMPMRCGGTIVFDQNDNVLHYMLKRRTPKREEAMLAYVAYLAARRRIGLAEQGFGATTGGRPVAASVDGGRLALTRDPALRHGEGSWRECAHG